MKGSFFAVLTCIALAGCANGVQKANPVEQAANAPLVVTENKIFLNDSPAGGESKKKEKPAESWEIRNSDRNLREAMTRWATAAGWQLVWEIEKDIQTGAAQFNGQFEDAVMEVARALQGSDMPIAFCTYENKVVRIVSSSLVCKRAI